MVTEDFDDSRSSSTLLVYFSAVYSLSQPSGSEFLRPSQYTPHLAGFIYYARLILLEATLPQFAHGYIYLPARPRNSQLEKLLTI